MNEKISSAAGFCKSANEEERTSVDRRNRPFARHFNKKTKVKRGNP